MIFIHRYELIRKNKPNQIQKGCLIKITDQDGQMGVADICPWPIFGDLNIDQELLQKGPLFQRALELANKDLQARKNKIHLISDIQIKNHILVSDYKDFDFKSVAGLYVKIKGDKNFSELAHILNHVSNIQIRLDFNFCLTESEFRKFIDLLSTETLKKIDVVEDPFPFDLKAWSILNQKIRLALDWNPQNHQWKNLICKPVRQLTDSFLYMTSVMDHPVGVAHGISMAQKYPDFIHGFLTNDLYKDCGFVESAGYGIGFDKQLSELIWEPLVDWSENSENQLFINPKLSVGEKATLFELSEKFNQEISAKNYFLIPSSGSSRSIQQSVKLIALKKSVVLSSANRVNRQFQFTNEMNWGCVLPTYHVGGLGIMARAHLSGSKVYLNDWKRIISEGICEWITKNQIQIISLVPAQIYDLIQKNIQCPKIVKTVFVGGSELSNSLAARANQLGWPVVQTYGMTETASMIAFKSDFKNEFFELMNGVHIQESSVVCDSLASYSIQKNNDVIQIQTYADSIFLSDQIQVHENKIQFLGRAEDQIQINSETVSMSELRSHLEALLIENGFQIDDYALVAVPDDRSDNKLILLSVADPDLVVQKFNSMVRPYEKIAQHVFVKKIPRTDLGKIKYAELRELYFLSNQL